MSMYFLYIAGGFSLLLFLYNFRAACTDFIYMAFKHWTHTAFILTCMTVGTLIGIFHGSIAQALPAYSAEQLAAEQSTMQDINACKDFVTAKLDHRANYTDPTPTLMELIRTGAHSYWERCAYVFGTNYWRFDISIGGESGGDLLCRAYHADGYRSSDVDTWCDTVFLPNQKI